MKQPRLKQALSSLIISILMTGQLQAEERKEEKSDPQGFVGGGLVGALLGGPIGMVVGAAGGGLIQHERELNEQLHQTQHDLAEQEAHLDDLRHKTHHAEKALQLARQEKQRLQQELEQAREKTALSAFHYAALSSGFSLYVQFRSGSAELEPHFRQQLHALKAPLDKFPELQLRVSGHADPRGSESKNLQLSERRVAGIVAALQERGIDLQRVHTSAHGEEQPLSQEGDKQGYVFDRRVKVSFFWEEKS